MLAVARRIAGPEDAEDVLHVVWIEAWRRAATYDPVNDQVYIANFFDGTVSAIDGQLG